MSNIGTLIEKSPQLIDQAANDMHRMVDYFGELRILVFVVAGVSMAVGIGYLMCMWTERRRRRKDERMYAQMYGVCPDYSKHGGVPLPHYMYNAPSAAYVQQQQQVYRGSDADTRSQHTTMRYTSRPALPPHMIGNGNTVARSSHGGSSHALNDATLIANGTHDPLTPTLNGGNGGY